MAAAASAGAISGRYRPWHPRAVLRRLGDAHSAQIIEGPGSGRWTPRWTAFAATCALIAKALLTQSAQWGEPGASCSGDAIKFRTPDVKWSRQRKETARLMGLGATDPARAIASDDHRVTCVGFGRVQPDKAVIFTAPLPEDQTPRLPCAGIVITLAWFSPVSPAWRSKLSSRGRRPTSLARTTSPCAAELLGRSGACAPPYFGWRGSVDRLL
ncbi:MAG: hypothetical protein R3C27_15790 [Hyphomonadaceae bacterium]